MLIRPTRESDIVDAVRLARKSGTTMRGIGSRHSVRPAYTTEGIGLRFDRYRAIRDLPDNRVECEAGVVLHTLCRHLEARGLALPNLGGITAQTVSGFLSTGSAGGSLQHAFETSIACVRIVTASGEVVDVDRDHPWFDAVGVSLGLLGVISTVTFACVASFGLLGNEQPMDFDGIREYYANQPDESEYSRALWYPAIDRGQLWQANRTLPLAQSRGVQRLSPTFQYLANAANFVGTRARPLLLRPLLKMFVDDKSHEFGGPWHEVLPQDEGLEFHRLPHQYCELWIPIECASDAMTALFEMYQRHGLDVMPTLPIEFYCSPASRFWMSPGYGRASFRINLIRYGWDPRNADEMYGPAYAALAESDPRAHWGKHQPAPPRDRDARQAFATLREEVDPDGVFLTAYWSRLLTTAPSLIQTSSGSHDR